MTLGEDAAPIHVATLPKQQSRIHRFVWPVTPSKWLASQIGCTTEQSRELIATLPISFPDRFNCLAYNPLRFLGLLAAMAGSPKVLIYETSGMDPRGFSLLHEYATGHYTEGTLIHRTESPVMKCPLGTECSEVDW
jgi:hypothetical protein